MSRSVNLSNKTGNEIYSLGIPQNLLTFLRYDFTLFQDKCANLCRFAMKNGTYPADEAVEVRNSVVGCHKYVEKNIRGIFEKLVTDCWIEYICRQNEIGPVGLWNSFMSCKNEFERVVFARLSEFRGHRAVNQWVNLLRVQEYAARKVEFVFGENSSDSGNVADASGRCDYFDLMLNVVANEMGLPLPATSVNVYGAGRLPNSPFVMGSISREIVRSIMPEITGSAYSAGAKRHDGAVSADQNALDAFAAVKALIPEKPDNITRTIIKSLKSEGRRVYIPAGFKAVIDLEIDALLESGGVLSRCRRCREFFVRDDDYQYNYCNTKPAGGRGGKTCLEIMAENVSREENRDDFEPRASVAATHGMVSDADVTYEHGKQRVSKPKTAVVDERLLKFECEKLYREMSERVGSGLTQRDFSEWYRSMLVMRENVSDGNATMSDFESFAAYSRQITSHSPKPAEKKPEVIGFDSLGREVKSFSFAHVERDPKPAPREDTGGKSENVFGSGAFPDEVKRKIAELRRRAAEKQEKKSEGESVTNSDNYTVGIHENESVPQVVPQMPQVPLYAPFNNNMRPASMSSMPYSQPPVMYPANGVGRIMQPGYLPPLSTRGKSSPKNIPEVKVIRGASVEGDKDIPGAYEPAGVTVRETVRGSSGSQIKQLKHFSAEELSGTLGAERDFSKFADILTDSSGVRIYDGAENFTAEEDYVKVYQPKDVVLTSGAGDIHSDNDGLPRGVLTAEPVFPKVNRKSLHDELVRNPYLNSILAEREDNTVSESEVSQKSEAAEQPKSEKSEESEKPKDTKEPKRENAESNAVIAAIKSIPDRFKKSHAVSLYRSAAGTAAEPTDINAEKDTEVLIKPKPSAGSGGGGTAGGSGTGGSLSGGPLSGSADKKAGGSEFSDMLLRSYELKDGFEEDIPLDADGIPTSHKTKRVMDAIFNRAQASPSLTIGEK